ncbi:MAG: UDP-N-acetylmuramoyl-L-alanyl-D-glutamate--2,6-diaminopimelate ligase [Muribaculaceae bacterium]|nr:UDP-N-acetylmuramoyl-L-alanyl-D-glutamate--2,6-diaminopimelate ligase [Muribaculaceae bacterium]
MILRELIRDLKEPKVIGSQEIEISGVECDSRRVAAGGLFIAVNGVNVDAHRFIGQVVAQGAAAVVCEHVPDDVADAEGVTWVVVANSQVALAQLASAWYGHPSRELKLVGITGTNGKTTCATLLYELARLMGYKAGLLSTVKNIIDTRESEAVQTTPDHLTLNRLLREMVDAGCDYAFMEVSSHACAQHRIDGVTFAGGVFTNLTRDHLDFHKTVDNYIAAKKSFFDSLGSEAWALVNADDVHGRVMVQNCRAAVSDYALRQLATFKCHVIEERLDGTTLELDGTELEVQFTGRFNAYNLAAVYGAARLLGWEREQVLVKMSLLVPVSGRFQTFRSAEGVTAIVDYAHTPDALVNVLDTINDVLQRTGGRVITVCGCGGNRDKGKRPIMAAEAARRSHQLILTSDNPRNERPADILDDMLAGLDDEQKQAALVIEDRAQAIRTACRLAGKGDVVLVAGKGHENYQEIEGVKHHFDDSEQVRLNLKL